MNIRVTMLELMDLERYTGDFVNAIQRLEDMYQLDLIHCELQIAYLFTPFCFFSTFFRQRSHFALDQLQSFGRP